MQLFKLSLKQFGNKHIVFQLNHQTINIHEYGKGIDPKAHLPIPESLNILLRKKYIENMPQHLETHNVDLVIELVECQETMRVIPSFYLRNTDLNSISIKITNDKNNSLTF